MYKINTNIKGTEILIVFIIKMDLGYNIWQGLL